MGRIDELARRRQAEWLNGADPEKVARLSDELAEEYAGKRMRQAGNPGQPYRGGVSKWPAPRRCQCDRPMVGLDVSCVKCGRVVP
jgi:hypothetical protein